MRSLLPLLFFALLTNSISAQVLDAFLHEINFAGDGRPRSFVPNGDSFYLIGEDGDNGRELWISDGTQAGTRMVKDIDEGFSSSMDSSNLNPEAFLDGIFYFSADDGEVGYELWRTDGTEAGTFMVKNLNTDDFFNFNPISPIYRLGDQLIFRTEDPSTGEELYVSDGTTAGTGLLKDIEPGPIGSSPRAFFIFDGFIYFSAFTETGGAEMWRSDGTEAGTTLFFEFDAGLGNGFTGGPVVVAENYFYFLANDGVAGKELWKSDGTPGGTVLLKDLNPGPDSSLNAIFGVHIGGDVMVFGGYTPATGLDPWVTDGTTDGTFLLADLDNTASSSIFSDFISYEGVAYFAAQEGDADYELWRSDGTISGTFEVKDIRPGVESSGPVNLYAAEDGIYFTAQIGAQREPWYSDGTSAGTFRLTDDAMVYDTNEFMYVQTTEGIFFQLEEEVHGRELWQTDGSPSGTSFAADLNLEFSGVPNELEVADIGNRLYFEGYNEQTGSEPYFFLEDDYVQVDDINPGFDSALDLRDPQYTRLGNEIFFFAKREDVGLELFKMNVGGTGATLVKDIDLTDDGSIPDFNFLVAYEDAVYFGADDGTGTELWRSDGTEAGTYMVRDLSTMQDGSIGNEAVVFNGYLYFQARTSSNQSLQLYRTDGTEEGTELFNSSPGAITLRADEAHLFFAANNNNSSFGAHFLFAVDTDEITQQVGVWDGGIDSNIRWATMLNNEIYVVVVNQQTARKSIIKSDGTPNAAVSLYEVQVPDNDDIDVIFTCGDYVYFLVETSGGLDRFLYRTDGTVEGTILVDEDNGSEDFFFFSNYTCADGILFYQRDFGVENIISYTGQPGSRTVHPLNPDVPMELIRSIHSAGDYLYIVGFSERHGNEMYVAEQNVVLSVDEQDSGLLDATVESNFILYPNPGTNRVTLKTTDNSMIRAISVTNLLGQEVMRMELNDASGQAQLQIGSLAQGIYLVTASTDSGESTRKLIRR